MEFQDFLHCRVEYEIKGIVLYEHSIMLLTGLQKVNSYQNSGISEFKTRKLQATAILFKCVHRQKDDTHKK